MIFQKIKNKIEPGVSLGAYRVKGFGQKKGEPALVYLIRNRHQKNVSQTEFQRAYTRLASANGFTRQWFEKNMKCAAAQPCNFTVIGESFVLLRIADYEQGKYTLRGTATTSILADPFP